LLRTTGSAAHSGGLKNLSSEWFVGLNAEIGRQSEDVSGQGGELLWVKQRVMGEKEALHNNLNRRL